MAHQWTYQDPGSVELGCMSSASSDLTSASSKYIQTANSLTTVAGSLSDWSGEAAVAWTSAATTLSTDLGTHRDKILDAKAAIGSYRDACISINNRAAAAQSIIDSANRTYAEPEPDPISQPTEFAQWQNDRYMAGYEIQDAQDEIYRLALERESADGDAVRGLNAALPPNWADTAASLASVGVTGVGDLTRQQNLDALLALSQRIADGDGSDADMDALSYLFGMYQNNESAMSQVFQDLGGEGTIKLIDEIGDAVGSTNNAEVAAALLLLAGSVRAGLSTGSANWPNQTARDFTSTMISNETINGWVDGNAAIAYLFSDSENNPMGETLSYELAVAIDTAERVNGLPLSSFNARADRGGNVLFMLENPEQWEQMIERTQSGDFSGLLDSAGEVFETLGEYPESAFEFLANDTAGDERIAYWYGERDWSGPDGWEGPAGLWLGASQIDGGPTSGLAYDPTIGGQEAAMTGQILEALAGAEGNPNFLTEHFSDAGARDFGAALSLHLDGIAQAMIGSQDGTFSSSTDPFLTFTDPITGETQTIANLSESTFANMLGQVGGNPAGAITIKVGADLMSQNIIAAAGQDPAQISTALDQVIKLQGIVDGSAVGATLGESTRSDAELREMVDMATGLVGDIAGFVPIPGSSFVGGSVGVGVGMATDAWADAWFASGETYPTVDARADDLKAGGLDRIPSAVATMLYGQYGETFGMAPPPPSYAGQYAYETWVTSTLDSMMTDHGVPTGQILDQYESAFNAGRGEADGD